jgi:2-oxoglutarate dehydrogenase E2 component (dihydrolipoamide succinyltransferase)
MSVSVSMPQLGESVTEGTVTRWLKKEGERVEVDEPLLEVSTDKVDTEIPSPASGILRGISVDEDETVAVGAQLAVIDDGASGDAAPGADDSASAAPAEAAQSAAAQADSAQADSAQADSAQADSAEPDSAQTASAQNDSAQPDSAQPAAAQAEQAPASSDGWSPQGSQPNYAPPAQSSPAASPGYPGSSAPSTPAYAPPPAYGQQQSRPYGQPAPAADAAPAAESAQAAESAPAPAAQVPAQGQPAAEESAPAAPAAAEAQAEEYPPPTPLPSAGDAPYVTPLVRKLAAEHAVDLESVTGTGVGGRIRKQDVIEAARAQRAAQPAQPPAPAQPAQPSQPAQPAAQAQAPQPAQPQPPQQARPAQAAPRPAVVPSSLRGTTQRMSRPRQVIAQRMVESLHVSAQLTTVVEADVTAIGRLRDQARQDFEAREGVKLSFLPFFALAAVEALKVHPKLNAVIDGDQVTYHDAEHLGIAVDTERGLMVPVIHNAGDLNIGGLARKISDLASRTRSGQVAPDELAGGTFTLTNTGSRGALFDTPIINQPQVAILGTGTVVKRPVVVTDPALGEVIAVRSMVYLALTYDHRLVDGADAARFLTTVKSRLEEGAFEAELGL